MPLNCHADVWPESEASSDHDESVPPPMPPVLQMPQMPQAQHVGPAPHIQLQFGTITAADIAATGGIVPHVPAESSDEEDESVYQDAMDDSADDDEAAAAAELSALIHQLEQLGTPVTMELDVENTDDPPGSDQARAHHLDGRTGYAIGHVITIHHQWCGLSTNDAG